MTISHLSIPQIPAASEPAPLHALTGTDLCRVGRNRTPGGVAGADARVSTDTHCRTVHQVTGDSSRRGRTTRMVRPSNSSTPPYASQRSRDRLTQRLALSASWVRHSQSSGSSRLRAGRSVLAIGGGPSLPTRPLLVSRTDRVGPSPADRAGAGCLPGVQSRANVYGYPRPTSEKAVHPCDRACGRASGERSFASRDN